MREQFVGSQDAWSGAVGWHQVQLSELVASQHPQYESLSVPAEFRLLGLAQQS